MRILSGHREGYYEAFAQIYTDAADGVCGTRFIEAVLDSSRRGSASVKFALPSMN